MYLYQILQKYNAKDLNLYYFDILNLKSILRNWANTCYIDIFESGSVAKNTAVSISSDVDFLISLTNNCNDNSGGLKSIYESLYNKLKNHYTNVRKQNVSIKVSLPNNGYLHTGILSYYFSQQLEVDITPARKQSGNTNDHSLWVSKLNSWKKTNIQKHINDISNSFRQNEIKLLKIWRELNKVDFPSIYLEYLVINNILFYKRISNDPKTLSENFWHILLELAKPRENPLFARVIDPANSSNILSELLTIQEKNSIIAKAKDSVSKNDWRYIIY